MAEGLIQNKWGGTERGALARVSGVGTRDLTVKEGPFSSMAAQSGEWRRRRVNQSRPNRFGPIKLSIATTNTLTHARKFASCVCRVARAHVISGLSFRFERGARCPAGRKPWDLPHQDQVTWSCPPRRWFLILHASSPP